MLNFPILFVCFNFQIKKKRSQLVYKWSIKNISLGILGSSLFRLIMGIELVHVQLQVHVSDLFFHFPVIDSVCCSSAGK